jgi:methionine biosynthesis protein MetW
VRDSAVKRALVEIYFNWREVAHAAAGMVRRPAYGERVDGYDAYWRHRTPGSLQPRFALIGDAIEAGASVLDVGCGDGVMLEFLIETKQVRALGIDVSAEAVGRAVARGVDARVQVLGDLSASGQTFDHVVMSEVVEHVADAERFVVDAWALTRKTLWLTFPNIAYFPHRLRLAAGKSPVQWVVFPGEHLRFWSASDFRAWIASLSLPAPVMVASNGFTFARLHRLWPNLFGNQIVVRCDR